MVVVDVDRDVVVYLCEIVHTSLMIMLSTRVNIKHTGL